MIRSQLRALQQVRRNSRGFVTQTVLRRDERKEVGGEKFMEDSKKFSYTSGDQRGNASDPSKEEPVSNEFKSKYYRDKIAEGGAPGAGNFGMVADTVINARNAHERDMEDQKKKEKELRRDHVDFPTDDNKKMFETEASRSHMAKGATHKVANINLNETQATTAQEYQSSNKKGTMQDERNVKPL